MARSHDISVRKQGTVREALRSWYRINARNLPWRRTNDPYRIWVSEIMLQQTRVDTVLHYYDRFLDRYPDAASLAHADRDELLKVWEGLGYYRRALNLNRAARIIMDQMGDILPRTAENWASLPGIGRYTAAAIASIAYGEPVAVLDGNVKRVLARLFAIKASIDDPAVEKQLWQIAQDLLDSENPGDHNQAMMELGATHCSPRDPSCDLCPLEPHCLARAGGMQKKLPVRAVKKAIPTRKSVVAVVFRSDGALLLTRRPDSGLLAGLWELPQVELKKGESSSTAFRRLTLELFRARFEIGKKVGNIVHTYSHFHLNASAFTSKRKEEVEEYLKHCLKKNKTGNYRISGASDASRIFNWLKKKNRGKYAIHRAHQKLIESFEK